MRPGILSVLVGVAIGTLLIAANGQIPPQDVKCETSKYPPNESTAVKKYVINLDLPPEQRWTELVKDKKNEIQNLQKRFVALLGGFMNGALLKGINLAMPQLLKTLPSPFKEEMQGLSDVSGMPLGEVVLYNLFYEFFTVCTSIIAQDSQGEIYHARNLDFGLFLGWDNQNHTWAMTEALRPAVVQLEFQRGGKTLFHSVNFAGYTGVLTGLKPNNFTLTIDDRFKANGGFFGIFEWIMGDHSQQWVGFLTRQLFENVTGFDNARQTLVSAKLLAPVYFILGGTQKGEGLIITKTRDEPSADQYWINNTTNKWYVLQTNYDHNEKPPFFDDRRTPGMKCMDQLTQQNGAGFSGLFNVLSTQPVLNKLTTYASLMHCKSGKMETYIQKCDPIDCTPW